MFPLFIIQWSAIIWQSYIYDNFVNITTQAEAEYKSDFVATKDTPYLALTGELWGVFCEDFVENWLCYNSTALYVEDSDPCITNDMAARSQGIRSHGIGLLCP